jgi:hypothetical protein
MKKQCLYVNKLHLSVLLQLIVVGLLSTISTHYFFKEEYVYLLLQL